jgi:TonB family protein
VTKNAAPPARGNPSRGQPTAKQRAQMMFASMGISNVAGMDHTLESALATIGNPNASASNSISGVGLHGSNSGGGNLNSVGLDGIDGRGRAHGERGYGDTPRLLAKKSTTDFTVSSDPTEIIGSLDKELIRKVIHANHGAIRFCYESQLARFPKLSGKVAIKFIINGNGTVTSSSVAQSTIGNESLESCIAGRVRTWIFPKPKDGIVVVTYPFLFKQSGE